jgi:hypothetical protein
LLLPALEIDDHVQQLLTALGKAPPPLAEETKKTATTLADLSKNLKPSRLESWGLPYLVPQLGGESTYIQNYQSKIASLAKRADGLDVIISKGLKPAWDAFPSAQAAGKEQAVRDAAHAIDALSPDPALDPAKAFRDCITILKTMDTALATGGTSPGFANVDAARAVERVRAEIRTLSLLAWIFFGIVSVFIGSYVLVLNNPGFGTTTDFILCARGFGLPVGGSQLSQLSVSNLSGVMGFQLSKTT